MVRVCTVECCGRVCHAKQLCKSHYTKLQRQKPHIREQRRKYNKEYFLRNREKCLEATRRWDQKNKEYRLQYRREKFKDPAYRGRHNEAWMRRRAMKIQATPKWLTEGHKKQLQQFYENCPTGFEVDHIIPLQGKDVRGLHVPWNLQYLPKSENRRKGNKIG